MTSIITVLGEKLFAKKAQANEQLDIDTFIFANVPGQDPSAEIDRNESVPHLSQQVLTQAVQQVGRVNENVVVYSTVLDSVTGPFEFNWVGLYSSVNDTLVAINHIPSTPKTATVQGVAGNTLNRNFGIEYSGIADLTGINVAPETWQLDFTARLSGIDELIRNLAKDLNGSDSFIDDGFKVVPRAAVNTFGVLSGVAYVNGIRVELEEEQILIADRYPKNFYVDAYFDGDASSAWKPKHLLKISSDELDNYIDEAGKQHYLVKIAVATTKDEVEDLRVSFTEKQGDYPRNFDTITDAKDDKFLKINQVVNIKGVGSAAIWDVVKEGTYKINFDALQHDSLPIQLKIRNTGALSVEDFGAGTEDDTGLFNFFVGKNYKPIANGEYNVTAIPSDISMFRGYGKLVLPSGEKIPMGSDFKQVTPNAVRPIPDADLSWVPFLPKVVSVGNVTTTVGVSHYAIGRENPASVGNFYIDPINGNDANGGSPALPLKTLREFLRVRTGNNGYMMGSDDPDNPVVFTKSDFRNTDPVGNRLKIVNVNGHCRIAEPVDDLTSLTWINEPGTAVYKCTTTSALINQLRYTKALDDDGGYLKIPSFTSVADVNNSLFGFWHDVANDTLYARLGGKTGDTFKVDLQPIVSDAASRMLFLGTAILFYCPKGSSLKFDGVTLTPLASGSIRARLYLHAEESDGIEIKNTFTHGIDALGAEYYIEHVKGTSTGGDNFHGFDSSGVSTLAVEVNCNSSFAGDVGTRGALAAGTDNGSAMHGTGHVARFGGKYYKNYGPDVVDSGSGAFWNCGVEAFGSTAPNNEIGFDITAGNGRMYLDTCLARDESLDEIQVNNGATLRTFNTTGNVTLVGSGVEYAYDPLSNL